MSLTARQRWAVLIAAIGFVGAMVVIAPQQAADFVRAIGQALGPAP